MDEAALGIGEVLIVELVDGPPLTRLRAGVDATIEIQWITETGEVLRVQRVTFTEE